MRLTLRVVRVVILALLATPVAAGVQQPGKPARLGILAGSASAFDPESNPFQRLIVGWGQLATYGTGDEP